ncbi:hypothetical protein [Kribbella monticola]|uniref:hypothetical protein n=1 Tax=Kribbella monticola TaxID=2185285 RepID=UPI0018E58956|nr:hypothetical protein [Kribbella monticola]
MVDRKMVKTVGEHWVCAMLARHGWAPALTRDGIARTDILAVATHIEERPSIEIQVKAATRGAKHTTWLLGNASTLAASQREWFVFVMVPQPPLPPRGFIVPRDHVVAARWIIHQNWMTNPDVATGQRNTPISQARVNEEVWAGYEDRWDLLETPTSSVPVLFPAWVRERALLDRVGLPPDHPWNEALPVW